MAGGVCLHSPRHGRGKCPRPAPAWVGKFAAEPGSKAPKKLQQPLRRGAY